MSICRVRGDHPAAALIEETLQVRIPADTKRVVSSRGAAGADRRPSFTRISYVQPCACGLRLPSWQRLSVLPSAERQMPFRRVAPLARWRVILRLAAATARFFATASFLVDGRPGTPLGLALGDATVLVAFLNMLCLTLLFPGVSGLVSAWHGRSPFRARPRGER
jgi:hypothetical protein